MSNKAKKVSAFAVFKGKKATSMTDMEAARSTPAEKPLKKSSSASGTPTNTGSRDTSISSFISKISGSDKKKQKADLKKVKKILKNSGKPKPSFVTETALQSPLVGNLTNRTNVELKSLRPKGSMANMRYQLPLKATPDVSLSNGKKLATRESPTPPLPPRVIGRRQASNNSVNSNGFKSGKKRLSSNSEPTPLTELPPKVHRKASLKSNKGDEVDGMAVKPAKRRRLSQTSAGQVSPQSTAGSTSLKDPFSERSALFSPEGARQRTEPLPSHPSEKDLGMPYMFDSYVEAKRLFECLIHPVKPHKFFSELWEKKPLLVKRHMPTYNGGWFSTAELDKIMREERLDFGRNVDVVTYTNGKRETHNPPGRAYAATVWDHYQNGCSVRLLNPHTYSKNVWKLLSILQEFFSCMAGANVYLTPPDTQGFAPHWDDIEAFILQLEGKKHWRLYSPRTENEVLPRFSSANLNEDTLGDPILDVILEAGDLLYFPKGTIHQGKTMEDAHSLHITISCQQLNSWGDLMEKLVPRALQVAIDEDVEFRKSLPTDYLNYMGVAFSDIDNPERTNFLRKIEQLMMKMLTYAPVDAACDQMAKKFIHDSLPPVLSEAEKACSVHGNGERWDGNDMRVRGAVEIEPDTEVKIIRKGAIRLVTEDEKVCVYHNLENARVYHGNEIQWIEVTAEVAPAIEYLLHSYPNYVPVDDLPFDTVQEKVELAAMLYEKGLLLTSEPLEPNSDNETDEEDKVGSK